MKSAPTETAPDDLARLRADLECSLARDGIRGCRDLADVESLLAETSRAFGVDDGEIGDLDQWQRDLEQEIRTRGFTSVLDTHIRQLLYVICSAKIPKQRLGQTFLQWLLNDPGLRTHFAGLPEAKQHALRDFLRDEAHTPEELLPYPALEQVAQWTREHLRPCEDILEGDGSPMQCLHHTPFRNWGRTVAFRPQWIFFPRTRVGACNLVRWATARGKRVRMSGYTHTWSDLYGQDDQVMASVLPSYLFPDRLPAKVPPFDPDYYELQGIAIVGTLVEDGRPKALCRIGAATTNEHFRRWAVTNDRWTLPLNVIMVEITLGGSNAPMCHGAGWGNPTLSDLVTAIEFVNPRGELQVVDDPQQIKAAAGCFGLLGLVTSLTLKLDPMSYAVLRPIARPVPLTIPPPRGLIVPDCFDMDGISERALEGAWEDFVRRCEEDYYAEWFWFPYQPDCWINTWRNYGRAEDAAPFPSRLLTLLEFWGTYLSYLLTSTVIGLLPGELQGRLFGAISMFFLTELIKLDLDEDGEATTYLIDALHFQRGIHNMRVRDVELEIPIPPRADDPTKPDWTICQQAWWAALTLACRDPDAPLRIALEMRIMAGSQVTMAPQYGNALGTCAIEVLTNLDTPPAVWERFTQEVADAWDGLVDGAGRRLNVRPHWAKEWGHLTFRGAPALVHLREHAYRERIPELRDALAAIGEAGGFTLHDLQQRFSNPLLDQLVFDQAEAESA